MHDARIAQEKLAKTELPAPGYFSAKGLFHDPDWVDSYLSIVLQWPKSCTISVEDRQLIGLAKSVAFNWEPGILNHTDLAFETGFKAEQITEAIKVVSAVVGLANLDRAFSADRVHRRLNPKLRKRFSEVEKYFGTVPRVFRTELAVEDDHWLRNLLTVTKPAYDNNGSRLINPLLRAYVALAGASVVGWTEGILLYSRAAVRFGAVKNEIHDVIRSVFKTSVSNSMAAGFRTPCHIPRLEEYRTILSSYIDNGGLAPKRKADRLFTPAEMQGSA